MYFLNNYWYLSAFGFGNKKSNKIEEHRLSVFSFVVVIAGVVLFRVDGIEGFEELVGFAVF